jgi:hypothetical protein
LEKLERMRLIRIVKSMDASPKERDRRYFIADPLIAFWYRFVQPNLSSVAQSFGVEVWRHQIAPKLGEFMGGAFEEICREHARRFSQEYFSAPAQEIGRIWQADYDIDVAGKLWTDRCSTGSASGGRTSLAKISSRSSSSAHPGLTTVATITSDNLF